MPWKAVPINGHTPKVGRRWEDYQQLAVQWRDEVANVRVHQTTAERPIDHFERERSCLRALPGNPFDSDEIVTTVATSHARIQFDGNRYSVPAEVARQPVVIRASADQVRILHNDREVASHDRSYDRRQIICQAEHQLQALQQRRRARGHQLEEIFDSLGEAARAFHLKLQTRPVKTTHHLRRLLNLVHLYGRTDVLVAIERACEFQTYDAAYVETILLQERRRRELPSPIPLCPKRRELIEEIELDEPDPAFYDRFVDTDESEPNESEQQDHDQT